MKFFRTAPPRKYSNYSRYRKYTRRDFQRVCAHCFRHEEEVGGEEHFVQDHFKPRRLPDVDPADYYNLYWSCSACNSRQNKGDKWPNSDQLSRGEKFCDPCDHDPVGTDYDETPAGLLKILTPAGDFTNRHIRLSKRQSLLDCREKRRNFRGIYLRELERLGSASQQFSRRLGEDASGIKRQICQELEILVQAYTRFVEREPFMICEVPPEIPPEIETLIASG